MPAKRQFKDIKSFKYEGHTFKRSRYKGGGWILFESGSSEPKKMGQHLIEVYEYLPSGRMRIGDLVDFVTEGPANLDDLISESAEAVSKAILFSMMLTFGHLSKSEKGRDYAEGLESEISELTKLLALTRNKQVALGIKSVIDTLEDLKKIK